MTANLVSIAALAPRSAQGGGGSSPTAPSVDTHAHVFKHGLKLAPVVRYAPTYEATAREYIDELDAHGVRYGVIIQPSFLGIDNTYLVDCLTAARDRLRGVAVVAPETPNDELLRLSDAGVVGVRLNLIGVASPDLAAPVWRAHLERVARLDWQVEVQCKAAEHAVIAPQLIASGVNLVVDHFGLPDPALGAEDPAWRSLLTLGASRRLWVKISAPYRLGQDGVARAASLYPSLKEKIGLDRLMWGSDWPNTQFEKTENYAGNRAFLDEIVPSPTERALILAGGKEIFKF